MMLTKVLAASKEIRVVCMPYTALPKKGRQLFTVGRPRLLWPVASGH